MSYITTANDARHILANLQSFMLSEGSLRSLHRPVAQWSVLRGGFITAMRQKAIEQYHRLLAADCGLTADLFARMRQEMRARRLLYAGRELGIALRPHFLTRAQCDMLARASQSVLRALGKVEAALLADTSLMDSIGLSDIERRLALVEPGFSHSTVTSRFDAFVFEREVKFIEFNAENPSSLTDQEGLNQVLFAVQALQSTAERYRLSQFAPAPRLLQSLISTYREWGGRGAPNIAILDWSDLPTSEEFILLRNFFVGSGAPAIICAPDELQYSNGKLRRGDFRIDLVYKRVIFSEFLARYNESHPLIQAYINHDVCLINPFRCKLLQKKACFELLTDEARRGWFTSVERRVIKQCVPWTMRVRDRATTYKGRRVDLLNHIRNHRADFVLKPNDDYGGRGITLGSRVSQSEWERAINKALDGDYVAQEAVRLVTEEFPVFGEREWNIQPMFVDNNPFMFRGRMGGVMVRLSDSPVVNVTSGGGMTGFFVLEGELAD